MEEVNNKIIVSDEVDKSSPSDSSGLGGIICGGISNSEIAASISVGGHYL